MNIFLTQTHGLSSEGLYLESSFMMDGCTFLSFILMVAIHCHYEAQTHQGVY